MVYEIDESRRSRYGVDNVGQINVNLTHLRGYGVMALELIQNADDAVATEISIDITDSALIVRNDAEFSSCSDRQNDECLRDGETSEEMCDWHAFRLISSGAKSERSVTTIGRFGMGFTSVYQITDNPEVECSGSKLIIAPGQYDSGWKKTTPRPGTVFTLPWAFDGGTPVRRRLKNVKVITRETLPEILTEINETSSESLVFLKNLLKISILNNGKVKSVFRREYMAEKNVLTISHQPSGKTKEYFYVSADFKNSLNFLEVKFPRDLGEKNRRHGVEIAIPKEFDSSKSGLIYAYLPTERNTLMPMNINGDFYPDSSRKDIILDRRSSSDALSEWNRTIIDCSADLFNRFINEIYQFLGYKKFWLLIESIFDLNEQIRAYGSDTSDCFGSFWKRFGLQSDEVSIIPMEGNEEISKKILGSFLLEGDDIKEKRQAVKTLGISTPSHKIQKQFEVLKVLGIEEIDFNVIVDALSRAQWVRHPKDKILPNDMEFKDKYLPVYTLLDSHIPRENASLIFRDSLVKYRVMPLLISHSGDVSTPGDLYFTENADLQNMAINLDPKVKFLNAELMKFSRIKGSCTEFRTSDALHLIVRVLQRLEKPSLPTVQLIHRLLILVTGNKKPLDDDLDSLKRLEIWPTASGALISADQGMIPGGFSDPLGNAEIVDVAKLEKKARSFLVEVLGIKILTLESYVNEILPNIFSSTFNNINESSYQKLLEELSKHHNKFENKDLVSKMQTLLFVPTEFGGFSNITNCAIGSISDKKRLFGIFENWFAPKFLPESKVIRQFLETLGLRVTPDAKNLGFVLRKVTSESQNKHNRQKVIRILDYVVDKKNAYSETEMNAFFSSVSSTSFLPAKGDFEYWYSPEDLLSPDAAEMVSSQQHLKILDICEVNIASIDYFVQKCGIETEPEVSDVVAHVRFCANSAIDVSNKVLKYLNRVAAKKGDDVTIEILRSLREIPFLKSQGGNVRPADLYKELHKIGAPWAYLLDRKLDFPDLFNALGIKQSPDCDDLIRILNEIKSSHIKSNDSNLSEERVAAYLQCWESLNNFCLQESIDDHQLIRLMHSDLFLNQNREFRDRNNLIIPDSEWFRLEFETEFGDYFVLDDHVYPIILDKLEFRYLSQNLKASLFTIEKPINRHEGLKREIDLRAKNIVLVLSEMKSANQRSFDWTSLDVYQTGSIQVEWALRIEDQDIAVTKSGNVYADLENRKLYITEILAGEDDQFNWVKMFKELFDQLFPAESRQILSGGVAMVSGLMAMSPEGGLEYLIDVGVSISSREASIDFSQANVKEAELRSAVVESEIEATSNDSDKESSTGFVEIADSQSEGFDDTSEESEKEIPSNKRIPELKSSEHRDRTQSSSAADSQSNRAPGERTARNESDRPRPLDPSKNNYQQNREIREAYIYIERESSAEALDAQQNKMESESQSRRIVTEHEISEGRAPEEMSVNNVGYDMESTEPNGDIRFIEIKSTKSLWGGDGVTLSSAQLNFAYIKKDAFWLYVIENIGSANSKMYKIQNPAQHIRGFKFNEAWKEIAVSLEHSADNIEPLGNGIRKEDLGTRILHVERGECFLIGWEQFGASVRVTLLFDDADEHVVLPLNVTKMKNLGA
jgi:hypothetical protein